MLIETFPCAGGEGTEQPADVNEGEGCGEGPMLENVVDFEVDVGWEEGVGWWGKIDASNSCWRERLAIIHTSALEKRKRSEEELTRRISIRNVKSPARVSAPYIQDILDILSNGTSEIRILLLVIEHQVGQVSEVHALKLLIICRSPILSLTHSLVTATILDDAAGDRRSERGRIGVQALPISGVEIIINFDGLRGLFHLVGFDRRCSS